MIFLLIWTFVLIAAVTLYLRQAYSRFQKYEVKTLKPLPFLGNMARVLFRKDHFANDIKNLYNAFPEER